MAEIPSLETLEENQRRIDDRISELQASLQLVAEQMVALATNMTKQFDSLQSSLGQRKNAEISLTTREDGESIEGGQRENSHQASMNKQFEVLQSSIGQRDMVELDPIASEGADSIEGVRTSNSHHGNSHIISAGIIKLKLSKFGRIDFQDWISRAEKFFTCYDIQFDSSAIIGFPWITKHIIVDSCGNFKVSLLERFGYVSDYSSKFGELLNRLLNVSQAFHKAKSHECSITEMNIGWKPGRYKMKFDSLLHTSLANSLFSNPVDNLPKRKVIQVVSKDLCLEAKSKGTEVGIVLGSILVNGLMKSTGVLDAFAVFERNVVTWNSMISGSLRNGLQEKGFSLFVEMLDTGVVPNDFTFGAALEVFSGLLELMLGEQVHSLVIRFGFADTCRIECCLIDFYSRCGLMNEAIRVFDQMSVQDLVGYTSLISRFCRNSLFDSAVRVFDRTVRQGLEPNEHTITSILMACGVILGKQIHGYMIKTMIDQSIYFSSALMELYSRNNEFDEANLVFDELEDKNMVTWSSMIACCLHNEQLEDALKLFHDMVCEGVKPNEFTFATIIVACGLCIKKDKLSEELHCLVVKLNFVLDTHVSNALVTMYSRNSEVEEPEKIFKRMGDHDVVFWCAVISSYFQNGAYERSIRLLYEMYSEGLTPNEYGFSSALSSCASITSLDQGRQIHCLALKSGCDTNICTGNALVNMYGKCGLFDDAKVAFDIMNTHDDMSSNSLIPVYAHYGHGLRALELFDVMVSRCFLPDHSTFLAHLVACSHIGYVDEAFEYFSVMTDRYGLVPTSSHYACMVDMMGRSGRLSEALHVEQMPFEPDCLIWKSLLGSCRLHGNLQLGKLAARKVIELSLQDSASYVLSNLHSLHEHWEDAKAVRVTMKDRGLKKDAGKELE